MNTIALDMTKSSIDTLPEINNIIEKSTPAIKEMSESFQDWGKSITQNPKRISRKHININKQLNSTSSICS